MLDKRYWIAGAVAAALLAGWVYSAKAGDLGGAGCCSDLEERVAEIESSFVRKGNRKVSLSLSGYLSHSVMWWDDGTNKDVYIGDGGAVSSRFRLTGDAKVSPDLTAGFLYEFGVHSNKLGSMTQADGGDDLGGAVELRQSTLWLAHKSLGKVKIGHGSTATDDLILIDLSGAGAIMTADVGVFNNAFIATPNGMAWSRLLNQGISFDTARRNHVMYETPSLMGFSVSAALAEDDYFDVALRYAGEFGGIRIAGGIGHSVDKETPMAFGPPSSATKLTETKGSVSAMHVLSGIFVTAAGGTRDVAYENAVGATAKDPFFWHVSAGIAKNWTGLGNTVLFAEYHQAKDMVGFKWGDGPFDGESVGSKATVMGLGVVQHLDAAAMEIFLSYKRYEGSVSVSDGAPFPYNDPADFAIKDFSTVIGGMRISF
jgi:predicted porin